MEGEGSIAFLSAKKKDRESKVGASLHFTTYRTTTHKRVKGLLQIFFLFVLAQKV